MSKKTNLEERTKERVKDNNINVEMFANIIIDILGEDLEDDLKATFQKKAAEEKEILLWNVVLCNICQKTGWSEKKLDNILTTLSDLNPWATLQYILKEIALELDKKYENHINDSEKIFAISPQDGRIHEVDKAHIKCYRAFPAFRTVEDAKFACRIVKKPLKEIFTNV